MNCFLVVIYFGLIIMFISLPFLQPVPTGGLSTVLGALIGVLGAQLAFKRESVWLPKFIEKRQLEEKTGQKLIVVAEKFFRLAEKIVRPRLKWIADSRPDRTPTPSKELCPGRALRRSIARRSRRQPSALPVVRRADWLHSTRPSGSAASSSLCPSRVDRP